MPSESLQVETASADVTVRALEARDLAQWEAYVNTHPDATFFHRAGWKRVIEAAFGHRTHFMLAERGGEIVGVLPLAEIRSRLFGHSLGALPFCAYGGILADHTMPPGAHSTRRPRPWPCASRSVRSNTAIGRPSMPTGRPRSCTSPSGKPSSPTSKPT